MAIAKVKLVGATTEKKLLHLENILTKMQRKLHKTVVGVIPPIPLFFFAEEAQKNGEIFQWLFPAAGTITVACMYVRDYADKDGVTFYANMVGPVTGSTRTFETRKNAVLQTLNIPVAIGDRLVFGVKTPERVKGIWVAFLFEMSIKSLGKEVFLIDEFSKIMDAESAEVTDSASVEVSKDAVQD